VTDQSPIARPRSPRGRRGGAPTSSPLMPPAARSGGWLLVGCGGWSRLGGGGAAPPLLGQSACKSQASNVAAPAATDTASLAGDASKAAAQVPSNRGLPI
jgi:hypothetical protein